MKRYAGVLLSVTSLPSRYGIGCFDQTAYDFVDWLVQAGQRYWQILPLGSTSHGGSDDSPYQAYSAFAGNPYLISLDALVEEGLLTRQECDDADFGSNPGRVDYDKLHENRFKLLHLAYERSDISRNPRYANFCRENYWWLNDYALFMALKGFFKEQPFRSWPEDIRMHWNFAVDYYNRTLYFDIEFQKFLQFQFFEQWKKLKAYANERHIQIVGDIPIYVSPDGADVWAHPELFQLDSYNAPTAIAGCPPDAFAADGQVWGNPLYRWEYHRSTGYQWWITRMWHSFQLYDVVRVDHFRGFDEYFSIPAGESTAKNGTWMPGPGMELFRAIELSLGKVNIRSLWITRISAACKMNGMNYSTFMNGLKKAGVAINRKMLAELAVNDKAAFTALTDMAKAQLRSYLCNYDTPEERLYPALINLAMASVAKDCIVPMQDHLGLDNSARMNQPGTVGFNWRWRLLPGQVTKELAKQVLAVTLRTNRGNWDALDTLKEQYEYVPAKEEETA